jgi:hypothetical protein
MARTVAKVRLVSDDFMIDFLPSLSKGRPATSGETTNPHRSRQHGKMLNRLPLVR